MSHDIVDNRNRKLIDEINTILDTTEMARFAVGYFFLSGLTGIAEKLSKVRELRLLIGNTTNKETLEQIAEGYRRLELIQDRNEEEAYPNRRVVRASKDETAENVRDTLELMDQTDDGERLIANLAQMIEEKRLKVKVYIKGRMHAKAYIFDYGSIFDSSGKPVERRESGTGIVGSSNLTISGISHNTELNVVVNGNDNHTELVKWFEELWNEAEDFDEILMNEMKESWALAPVKPYDIYMKTLYTLVKDRLEGGEEREILWDDEIYKELADFQKVAVRQIIRMIRSYGGGFAADVVGLGKSFIGAAIIKHFERSDRARPLIICPAQLVDMWERYNWAYDLNARIFSMGMLTLDEEESNVLFEDADLRNRDFILVDESHNFRNIDTQRYRIINQFITTGKRCCFLTATPRNKTAWDVFNQIKLFHKDDKTDLPVDPPDLRQYFKLIEKGERELKHLLRNVLYRRTRRDIIRWYGFDAETHEKVIPSEYKEYITGLKRAYVLVGGKHQFFPLRELETISYNIEDAYTGLYQDLRNFIGKPRKRVFKKPPEDELSYARYGLWHYVLKNKREKEPYVNLKKAGSNLRGLMRVLLFKRFESSVFAFQQSIRNLLVVHERFRAALEEGIVPAGEEAQTILYEEINESEERDIADILADLTEVSQTYKIEDFDIETLKNNIDHDVEILKRIYNLVEPITSDEDAKLQTLIECLSKTPLSKGKVLIFTQYADTAKYLYRNLNPDDEREDIAVIYSSLGSKTTIVGRFAPKANPEYVLRSNECELNRVIATDVLAEGLNLQDCDKIINYDLHWNPVRLIQRFGRIDRIGSEHDRIYGYNFLPELGIEKNLGLKQILLNRIQEIHDTIGEDAAILDPSERINEESMYAIYESKNDGQLSLFEADEDEEEFIDLYEAEELLRQLRSDNPDEYERIQNLRDGIRTGYERPGSNGMYVFCQAGRFQQLFLVNDKGEIISRDIPKILGTIKCEKIIEGNNLPKNYNEGLMKVKRMFDEEVKLRKSEREHSLSLTLGQKYLIRELKSIFTTTDDDDVKERVNLFNEAFRRSINPAINKELNRIRKNSLTGDALMVALRDVYLQHNMKEWNDNQSRKETEQSEYPRIVCSEALL